MNRDYGCGKAFSKTKYSIWTGHLQWLYLPLVIFIFTFSWIPSCLATEFSLQSQDLLLQLSRTQFEEPLVPTAKTTEQEDRALVDAIEQYRKRTSLDDFTALTRYIEQNPKSGWNMALWANLGLSYYRSGYFSLALDAFEHAWQLGRDAKDHQAKALADRAFAELTQMHARVGHADTLEVLLKDAEKRPFVGSATELVSNSKIGLWRMRHTPGGSFLCGPMALKNLLLTQGATNNSVNFIDKYQSSPQGTTLSEVGTLATKAKLNYKIIYRKPGQPIPIPSIIHWKVSHYAAIVEEKYGRYHIKDPTFGNDLWVSQAAIDHEASGYFLVDNKIQSADWRPVQLAEASLVRGMGDTGNNVMSSATTDNENMAKDPPCDGNKGMCGYNITEMLVSLHLRDTPVGYKPAVGPAINAKLTYNQREVGQPANFGWFNVGQKWTFNWLTYISDIPGQPGFDVSRYAAGGGFVNYVGYNSTTGQFTPETADASVLVMTSDSPIKYERRLPDGGVEVYAQSNGATTAPRRIFLTELRDAAGNVVKLDYDTDSQGRTRLIAITDAIGTKTAALDDGKTIISYEYPNTSLITKITDPFGRSASLTYDANDRLTSITDEIGLTSSFTYDASSLVNSMTTPYGTTTFTFGESGSYRFLEATDPLGYKERVEFNAPITDVCPVEPFEDLCRDEASTVPPSPTITTNRWIGWRNTFYWDKNVYASAKQPNGTMDYKKARIKHWLHLKDAPVRTRANTLESIKYPLENRIWFNYPGQIYGSITSGTFDKPTRIARVLDDGTTQLTQNEYNALGNVTKTIDPQGRETVYEYAANQIDVETIKQKTSATGYSTIASFTYNSQHLPLTYTDAAGKTTTYTYNTSGQMTSQTDALGRVTTYTYNALGYLTQVTNPNGVAEQTLTYDTVGRVKTRTDSEGYQLKYDYDNFDRLVKTTYPDLTTEIITYNKLDKATFTDRKGRVTSYTYDAVRNLKTVTDPVGGITRYDYYPNGKLYKLTDANNNVTTWNRDIQSRVTEKVYANNSKDVYTYENTTSRLKSIKDARNLLKKYDYFKDDQLQQITYWNVLNTTPVTYTPHTATPNVSFTYDPYFKRVDTMTDGNGTTNYQYHPIGSLGALKLKQSDGPFANDVYSYQYNAVGNVTTRTIANVSESYGYDSLDRVTSHGTPLGTFANTYLGETGQMTSQHLQTPTGLGVGTDWQYDDNAHDRRLMTIDHGSYGKSFSYTSSPSRIDSIHEYGVDSSYLRDWTYTYDNKDRVTNALVTNIGTNKAYGYQYDVADNLTARTDTTVTPTVSKTYTPTNLNQVAGTVFTYDANGNRLTDDKGRLYEWDAENRLVKVSFPANMATKPVTTISYDGLGHWTKVTTTLGTTVNERRFLWCGEELCQRRNVNDAVQKRYHGEAESGLTPAYYMRDHLGSVHGIDTSTLPFLYDPYGWFYSNTGVAGIELRYAGMYYLPDSHLYLANYRAYDPTSGRWLSRDPIAEQGGINLYGYVGGNVVNKVDPLGLFFIDPTGTTPDDASGPSEIRGPSSDSCGCLQKSLGLDIPIGSGLVIGGQPLVTKRFIMSGTSEGTSLISSFLSKKLPQRLPFKCWAPTTVKPFAKSNKIGRILGRWSPFIGWGILGYDTYQYMDCLNQCEY